MAYRLLGLNDHGPILPSPIVVVVALSTDADSTIFLHPGVGTVPTLSGSDITKETSYTLDKPSPANMRSPP